MTYFRDRNHSNLYLFVQILQPLLLDQNIHLTAVRMTNDDQSRDVEIIIPDTQPPAPTATPVPVHCHSIEMQPSSPTHRDIAGIIYS